VRLIGNEGEQLGVVTIKEALIAARELKVDLVELQPNAAPPVCRLMDYGKFLYQQKKKSVDAKKKQRQMQVKEIKFRPGTEEADYQVKLRNLIRFLEQGDKVKITIRFRGREMTHQELGMEVLDRLAKDIEGNAIVEQRPKIEGRQLVMVAAPGKGTAK
jgi:translation initiation factor IF-3